MRFYFDVMDGDRESHDEQGVEICSMRLLKEAAVSLLPALANDPSRNSESRVLSVKVRDRMGRYVLVAVMTLNASWLGEDPTELALPHIN